MFENKYYDKWWGEIETKQKYPHPVTFKEWHKAKVNWATWAVKRRRKRANLANYIGDHSWVYNDYSNHGDVRMWASDEAYHLIQLCLSPYFHALLSAYWLNKHNSKKRKNASCHRL